MEVSNFVGSDVVVLVLVSVDVDVDDKGTLVELSDDVDGNEAADADDDASAAVLVAASDETALAPSSANGINSAINEPKE